MPYDKEEFSARLKALIDAVDINPAKVEFPTDTWGYTSELKKVVLKSASQVKGQDDKHDLLVGTLLVLLAHIRKRKAVDVQEAARRQKEREQAAAELLPRQSFGRVSSTLEANTNG